MNSKFTFSIVIIAGIAIAIITGEGFLHREPDYKSQWVDRIGGTNALALTQIITGEEPYVLTFSIPLDIDVKTYENGYASTNDCWLEISDNGRILGDLLSSKTNGVYRIRYETPFSPPGSNHTLRIGLVTPSYKIFGPPLTVQYTNLFRFDQNLFRDGGVPLRCRLGIERAGYKINIYDTNKNLLFVIAGQTTNGVIDEVWDLRAFGGVMRNDDEFFTDYYVWYLDESNKNFVNTTCLPTNPCPYNYIRLK